MASLSYWARLLKLFYHYQKKSSTLPYMPIRLWVELTSFCNFRCVMCPNKDLEKKDKGYMDMDLYRKIVDEAKEFIFDINLNHRGESLLHPEIVEAIKYAKQNKMFARLHTNASLLSEDLAKNIITAGLDRISFSFDGYTKETYEKIRRGGDFDKTIKNILRFLEIKKSAGAKTPQTAIEAIDFEKTAGEELEQAKREFRSRFRDLPPDSFVIKEFHNWAGEIKKKKHNPDNYSVCPFPWNALIILWDGSVLPCTQDFFNQHSIGNVKDNSIREIWNGDKIIHLRKKLTEQDLDEFKTCSNCDRIWRKGFFGVPKKYIWKFISKRMP